MADDLPRADTPQQAGEKRQASAEPDSAPPAKKAAIEGKYTVIEDTTAETGEKAEPASTFTSESTSEMDTEAVVDPTSTVSSDDTAEKTEEKPWIETITVGSQVLAKFKKVPYKATIVGIQDKPDREGCPYLVQFFNPVPRRQMCVIARAIDDLLEPYNLPPPPAGITAEERKELNPDRAGKQGRRGYKIDKGSIVFVRWFEKGPSAWYPAVVLTEHTTAQAANALRRVRFLNQDKERTVRRKDMLPVIDDSPLELDDKRDPVWLCKPLKNKELDKENKFVQRFVGVQNKRKERLTYSDGVDRGVDPDPEFLCKICALPLDRGNEEEMTKQLCDKHIDQDSDSVTE